MDTVTITCGNCGHTAPWERFAFDDRKDHRGSLVGFKIGCTKCRHSTYIGKKPCPSCSRMVGHSRNCQAQELLEDWSKKPKTVAEIFGVE